MAKISVGVGSSKTSGAEAARAALAGCSGLPPAAALVFSAYRGVDHYAVLKGVRDALPGVPLAGGTTFGEISGPELLEGSTVVWLLAGKGLSASTGLGKGMGRDPFAAGAQAAREARAAFKGEPKLFLIFYETQAGDPKLAVEGAKSVLGKSFPIVGAGTGSGLIMEQNPFSKQFCGAQVLGGCFTGLLMGGDFSFSCAYSHGGHLVSPAFTITEADRNVVRKLDGRPALDVFEEALDLKLGLGGLSYLDVHLAVVEPDIPETTTIRALWGASASERTLYCGNPVDAGMQVRFAQVRAETILSRQKETVAGAVRALGRKPVGALCIDCYGRKMTLGARDMIGEELGLIREEAGLVPMGGLYSGSETAVLGWGTAERESRYCHQSTAVVLFGES